MIQATMHEWVRGRLHDSGVKQRFSDGLITSALNLGAQEVQARVQAVDPDAFFRIYSRNLQADDKRYQHPRGMLRIRELYLDYGDGQGFLRSDPIARRQIDDPTSDLNLNGFSRPVRAVSGGEIAIWPTPTEDVENGFQLHYVPSLGFTNLEDEIGGEPNSTGADEDLADYGLVEPLHKGVWLWAVHTLLPNDGEPEAQKLVEYEFEKCMKNVPTYYGGQGLNGGVEEIYVEGLGLELD